MTRFQILAVAAAVSVPALASAQSVSVETAIGRAEVPLAPETVAAYDLAALDTLDALGVDVAGVPDFAASIPHLQDSAEGAEVVGTLFEPDLEALNAIAPDLVIVGSRSSEQLDSVSRVAPAIDMTVWGDDVPGQALARLEAYGRIFGLEEEAAAVAETFNQSIEELRAATDGKGSALIVMTNGPKVSAYGAASRFGWVHEAAGLPEAVEGVDAATHGEAISFEFIHDANPDWLIVIDRAAAIGSEDQRAEVTLDNALVADTNAWKNGNVIYVDGANIYLVGGGIQAMTQVFETLTEAFTQADS